MTVVFRMLEIIFCNFVKNLHTFLRLYNEIEGPNVVLVVLVILFCIFARESKLFGALQNVSESAYRCAFLYHELFQLDSFARQVKQYKGLVM